MNKMMTCFSALLVLPLLAAACDQPSSKPEVERKETITITPEIERLEAVIAMPEGAKSLSQYDRYYLYQADKVRAIFLSSIDGKGKAKIVNSENFPMVLDGGCDVIQLSYDRKKKLIESIFCHGVA